LALHEVGFVSYEYPPISAYLILVQSSFSLAFVIGTFIRFPLFAWQYRCKANESNVSLNLYMSFVFFASTILLTTLVGYELLSSGRSILDIGATRTELWDSVDDEEEITKVSMAKSIIRPVVIAFLFMTPISKDVFRRTVGVFAFLVIGVGESLLAGGRAFLAFAISGLVFSNNLKTRFPDSENSRDSNSALPRDVSTLRLKPVIVLVRTFAVVVALYMTFGVFPAIRNPDLTGNEDLFLKLENGNSFVSPLFRDLGDKFGIPSITVFAYGTYYLTSPMMRSNYLLLETDATEWYLLGEANFPVLSKITSRILGGRTSERTVKERIERAQPYGKNPWYSGIAEVFIDFGLAGGIAFMFFLGLAANWMFQSLTQLRQPEYYALYSMMIILLLAFPMFGVLRMSMYFNPTLMCLAILFVRAIPRPANYGLKG